MKITAHTNAYAANLNAMSNRANASKNAANIFASAGKSFGAERKNPQDLFISPNNGRVTVDTSEIDKATNTWAQLFA